MVRTPVGRTMKVRTGTARRSTCNTQTPKPVSWRFTFIAIYCCTRNETRQMGRDHVDKLRSRNRRTFPDYQRPARNHVYT